MDLAIPANIRVLEVFEKERVMFKGVALGEDDVPGKLELPPDNESKVGIGFSAGWLGGDGNPEPEIGG